MYGLRGRPSGVRSDPRPSSAQKPESSHERGEAPALAAVEAGGMAVDEPPCCLPAASGPITPVPPAEVCSLLFEIAAAAGSGTADTAGIAVTEGNPAGRKRLPKGVP